MNLSTFYLRVNECSATNESYEVFIFSEITEVVFIVLVNAFTLATFATNHQLRKRSTYLIINLTVADLLFGINEGLLSILVTAILERYLPRSTEEWFSWQELMLLTLYFLFPVASLVKILLISLERLHATKYPFKHCLIGGKVYFRIIATLFSVISVHSSTLVLGTGSLGQWTINFSLTDSHNLHLIIDNIIFQLIKFVLTAVFI